MYVYWIMLRLIIITVEMMNLWLCKLSEAFTFRGSRPGELHFLKLEVTQSRNEQHGDYRRTSRSYSRNQLTIWKNDSRTKSDVQRVWRPRTIQSMTKETTKMSSVHAKTTWMDWMMALSDKNRDNKPTWRKHKMQTFWTEEVSPKKNIFHPHHTRVVFNFSSK